jgi:cation transport regulator ChaB
MPQDTQGGDVPSTLKRSPKKARDTWSKAHDSAVQTYGEGERAHRTAFSALKHSFEKVGDHWEAKDHKGPSDPQAKKDTRSGSQRGGKTYGGVDLEGSTKQELLEKAKKLKVRGRSRMTKEELAEAINKANQRETAKARKK